VAASAVVLEALGALTASASGPPPAVPVVLRRVVLAACGAALTGAWLHPAYARPGPHRDGRPAVTGRIVGLPLPELVPSRPPHRSPVRSETAWVVVAPGDSLWSIAERELPPDSTVVAVAARWRAIYHVNRALIGPDPDLISPGTRLRLPGRESS
jgi:nucleoid-associated protein YgaU